MVEEITKKSSDGKLIKIFKSISGKLTKGTIKQQLPKKFSEKYSKKLTKRNFINTHKTIFKELTIKRDC